MTNSQPVLEQGLRNPELMDFVNITKLQKKTEFLEKFEFPDKTGFKLIQKRKRKNCSCPNSLPGLTLIC